jgi:hypothetical protein
MDNTPPIPPFSRQEYINRSHTNDCIKADLIEAMTKVLAIALKEINELKIICEYVNNIDAKNILKKLGFFEDDNYMWILARPINGFACRLAFKFGITAGKQFFTISADEKQIYICRDISMTEFEPTIFVNIDGSASAILTDACYFYFFYL